MTGAGWPTQFRVWLPMACVITVTGLRAKSGKTTVAVNLAASFVMEGYSCMLIDLAGTADASRALGVSVNTGSFAASAVLGGQASLMAVRLPTASGIDLVAGHSEIAVIAGTPGLASKLLREQLDAVANDYNYVLLDTSGWLGAIESVALAVAEQVVITYCPGQAGGRGLSGLSRLQQAYITGLVGIVANKVLPDWTSANVGGKDDGGTGARSLGAIRYVPELPEMSWRGLPPVLLQPHATFAQDIQSIANCIAGS